MNHVLLTIAFATLSCPMIAMQTYKLPNEVALAERLAPITPADFRQKTQLIPKLADQDLTAQQVAAIVAEELLHYNERFVTISGRETLWATRPLLTQTVMQDHPTGIKDLQTIETALAAELKRLLS